MARMDLEPADACRQTGAMFDRRMLVAGALAAGLGACKGAVQRPMFAADAHPADYPTVLAVGWFAKELEARSGGRLRIRQYPGGQLGEEKDTLELTIFGGIDINRISVGPLNAIAPETYVTNLPFLYQSPDHLRRVLTGSPGQKVLASLAPHGLVGLCFYEAGARSFYTSSRRIDVPADLKGLKIRVPNSDLLVAMVEALGANATPMSFGEVYGALLQRVIDGAENNYPSYESSRHYEAAPHFSLTQHLMVPEVLVVSMHRWRKLSSADQELLRQCAAESVDVMQRLWTEREAISEQRVRAAGVKVHQPADKAPFSALMEPVWARFAQTAAMRSLVDDILALGRTG